MKCSFEYGYTQVDRLRIGETRTSASGKTSVLSLEVDGRPAAPTRRFWKSFFMRFGVSDNIFRYFSPEEVFERISHRAADDSLRYCLEVDQKGAARLLAVSSPKRPVIGHPQMYQLANRFGGTDLKYEAGVLHSTHTPRSGDQTFQIGGDRFQHRFVLETPIDGFGHPRIYLSFLRMICANGAIGYSRAFRSDISLGKDIGHCISRALESFDNGDGYAALRQRFESAQRSWASMHECLQLYKALSHLGERGEFSAGAAKRDLCKLTGNLHDIYGLANLDALSTKRQRVLPARCRVYDLINFASEIATHHATTAGGRTVQAYIGSLISDEYDMEGTADSASEFSDFFVSDATAGPKPSLN